MWPTLRSKNGCGQMLLELLRVAFSNRLGYINFLNNKHGEIKIFRLNGHEGSVLSVSVFFVPLILKADVICFDSTLINSGTLIFYGAWMDDFQPARLYTSVL